MNRQVLGTSALLVFGFAFVGCTEDESSIVIASHPFLTGSLEEESEGPTTVACSFQDEFGGVVSAGSMAINLSELASGQVPFPGVPGLSIQSNFLVNVDLQNSLASTTNYRSLGETAELRTETNQVEVRSIAFTFEADDNNFSLDTLDKEVRLTKIVYPGGLLHSVNNVIDTATADVEAWRSVVSGHTSNDPNAIVPGVLTIQAFGVLQGGDEIESNRLKMPVEICDGCQKNTTASCMVVEGS
jgi:hypothetical protein